MFRECWSQHVSFHARSLQNSSLSRAGHAALAAPRRWSASVARVAARAGLFIAARRAARAHRAARPSPICCGYDAQRRRPPRFSPGAARRSRSPLPSRSASLVPSRYQPGASPRERCPFSLERRGAHSHPTGVGRLSTRTTFPSVRDMAADAGGKGRIEERTRPSRARPQRARADGTSEARNSQPCSPFFRCGRKLASANSSAKREGVPVGEVVIARRIRPERRCSWR